MALHDTSGHRTNLCLLFLAKPCSHQIACLLYAVLLLGCILTVGGKPWCVNVVHVHQVQREGGFTIDNQEKWGVASDCLNTAVVGQTH